MSNETPSAIDKIDLATLYTPGQLDVLTQLREIQQTAGMSDAAFVQKHLTVSSTTWSRINSGTYSADAAAAFVKLENSLRQLRIERAHASKLTGGGAFHSVPWQQSVVVAITEAKLKPADDCERMVAVLAPHGSGKTRLARELKIMHDGILVEASEPWRGSYYAALCDIGVAAGLTEAELGKGVASAQRAVLRRLRANRRVLIIDEGEYFGPAATNLLKLILNQTPTVVVLLTLPILFERWEKTAWAEAPQLIRRCEAVVESQLITPDDVLKFAAGRVTVTGTSPKAAWAVVAKAANDFARFSLVVRVVASLERDGGEATAEKIATAVTQAKALLRRKEGA
jgi:hypothetical protein